jgi:cortical fragment-lytic enzyme
MYACTGLLALALGAACPASGQENKPRRQTSHRSRKTNTKRTPVHRNIYRRKVLNARPLRMFYYFDDTRGFESLESHGPGITVLAPQCIAVNSDGTIHGSIPARVVATAKEAQLPIMPLIFNQGFDRGTVSALLHSTAAQERAVRAMAEIADRDDVVGFQIDFENMAPADHHLFSLFVRRAAARMHQNGRLLSVAVTPQFSEVKPADRRHRKIIRDEWSGAYEYRALGRYADLITLMTYDHSGRNGPPGPIAGYAWVRTAVKFAIQRVPHTKLLLGLPLYGREWTVGGNSTQSRSLTFGAIRSLIERPEIHVQWDAQWRSPWFEYSDGTSQRTVWYEDSRSLKEKLDLMEEFGLRGFAAWRLGDEGPDFWPLIASTKIEHIRRPTERRRHIVQTKPGAKIEPHSISAPSSVAGTGRR